MDLSASSELFLSDDPSTKRGKLGRSARIGVDYAESWADKPWRFFERDNRWVSRARPSVRGRAT